MKHPVHLVLTLVLCLVLSISGVLVGVLGARAAKTGTWTQLPLYESYLGEVLSLAVSPAASSTIYAGTEDGVFRSTNSGATWTAANTGDLEDMFPGQVLALVINPDAPTTIYAAVYGRGIFRSTDSAVTWTRINTGLTDTDVWRLVMNPANPAILYVATMGDGVFRSTDGGDHWRAVNDGLPNMQIHGLAISPRTPATLYAGTFGGGVFRSTDSGTLWTRVNSGLKDSYSQQIESLAVDPLTPSTVYAGTWGAGLFRSTNSGATWKAIDIDNYHYVSSIIIDPPTPTTMYVNGHPSNNCLRSTDSGATWSALECGGSISCLALDPHNPSILYAGGSNGGIFRYNPASSYVLTTTISPAAGGSIKRSPNGTSYAAGTVVALTAMPATGYTFTGWSGALSGTKNPVTVTMGATKKVTASFAAKVKSVIQLKIGSKTMYVDGKPVVLEAAPIILNARTFLPIRAVVEAVGGTIAWDALAQKVTIVRKGQTLKLWIGRNVAELDDKSVKVDDDSKVVPVIMSGRTLLPLRFVAEALALDVQWDAATQTITITYQP
jgi:uncharacterized repeat protein (TIGR02543 family)